MLLYKQDYLGKFAVNKMNAFQVLDDNYNMQNNSFLYYLREKSIFNKEAFKQLYDSIYALAEQNVEISAVALKIHIVHYRIIEALMYHFDADDAYKITNLPENYNKILAQMEKAVVFYFQTRI